MKQSQCKSLGSRQAHLSRAPCVAKPPAGRRAVRGSRPGTCGRGGGAPQAAGWINTLASMWQALQAVNRQPGSALCLPCAPPELQHHVGRSSAVLPPQLLQVAVELLPRGRVVIKVGDLDAPHVHVVVIRECNLQVGRGGAAGRRGRRRPLRVGDRAAAPVAAHSGAAAVAVSGSGGGHAQAAAQAPQAADAAGAAPRQAAQNLGRRDPTRPLTWVMPGSLPLLISLLRLLCSAMTLRHPFLFSQGGARTNGAAAMVDGGWAAG